MTEPKRGLAGPLMTHMREVAYGLGMRHHIRSKTHQSQSTSERIAAIDEANAKRARRRLKLEDQERRREERRLREEKEDATT